MIKFECAMGHVIPEARTAEDIERILACVYCVAVLDGNMREMDKLIQGADETVLQKKLGKVVQGDKDEEIKEAFPN